MLRKYLAYLPVSLTSLRALLAPAMVALSFFWPDKAAFLLCLIVAFLSDVFDSIIARRLRVATPALRRFDSVADSIFYAAALFVAWRLYADELGRHWIQLCVLIAIELLRLLFDQLKFKQQAAYHMYSSKLWGLCLFAAFLLLLGTGRGGVWIDLAIYVGIIADLEGLAISIVLDRAATDVPTLFHALRRRSVSQSRGR